MANLLIVGGLEWRLHDKVDAKKLSKDIKENMKSDDGKVLEVDLEIEGETLLVNCNSRLPYVYLGVPVKDDSRTQAELGAGMPSVRSVR